MKQFIGFIPTHFLHLLVVFFRFVFFFSFCFLFHFIIHTTCSFVSRCHLAISSCSWFEMLTTLFMNTHHFRANGKCQRLYTVFVCTLCCQKKSTKNNKISIHQTVLQYWLSVIYAFIRVTYFAITIAVCFIGWRTFCTCRFCTQFYTRIWIHWAMYTYTYVSKKRNDIDGKVNETQIILLRNTSQIFLSDGTE